MKRPFAYVCSPYRGKTEKNVELARACLPRKVPLDDDIPEERENGLSMARDLLRRSNIVVSCGSKYSEGMLRELILAKRLRIPSSTLSGILVVNRRGKESTE